MKIITLVALLCSATLAKASVIIYTASQSETVTGQGLTVITNYTGYFVWDVSAGAVAQVGAFTVKKTKFFETDSTDSLFIQFLSSGLNQQTTCLAKNRGDEGAVLAKGKDSLLSIGDGSAFGVQAPKTMTISGHFIEDTTDGTDAKIPLLHEFKGTLTFNSALTIAANQAGNDLAATIAVLENRPHRQGLHPRTLKITLWAGNFLPVTFE